jgi:Fic family protein
MSYAPPYTITSTIIDLISQISEYIGKLEYLERKSTLPKLRRISKIKTITGTLQIEGNTLSEEKITAILNGKQVLGTVSDVAEAKGAIELYNTINTFNYKQESDLLKAHKILMNELLKKAGNYRTSDVGVGGTSGVLHIAPPSNQVTKLMNDLFFWITHTKEHPLIVSSIFHYEFEFIHPFIDGNGRMGRFWQNLILQSWKNFFSLVPVESIVRDRQQEYYNVLELCGSEGESTIFIEFMLESILKAIKKLDKSDQVNNQVSDQVKKLLSIMGDKWLSSSEMMYKLGLKHKPTFRKNYLNKALEDNLIKMFNPKSPRSPTQKYKKC